MICTAQLVDGAVRYAEAEILPNIPIRQQFLAGMALALAREKCDTMIRNISKNAAVQLMGLVSESGEVDAEALYRAAKAQFAKTEVLTVNVPMLGEMRFHESDLDRLYAMINGGAQ